MGTATRSSDITVTDLFCGAGGSSSGLKQIKGIRVRQASNHWNLAVAVHNENHPEADHDCADISQVDPRRYPTTTMAWMSPECTNHSQAKGRKRNIDATPDLFGETLPDAAAERSRATMWDVVRFAEHHRYQGMIIENVVDAAKWISYRAWRIALQDLGYCLHTVYLNSMFASQLGAPAPQSRDRMYVVAHQKTSGCPDLDRWTRPQAYCPNCDTIVRAVQAWKKDTPWGRYRAQYVWRCPSVSCRNTILEPYVLPAAAAIDWSVAGERIGDRTKDLAPKTRARIAAALAKYARPVHLEAAGNTYDATSPTHPQYGTGTGYVRGWPVDEPLRTVHTTPSKGVAYAPGMLVPVEGRDGKAAAPVTEAMRTLTTRAETGLAIPPFIAELRGGGSTARPVTDPLATITAGGTHHGLVVPAGGTWNTDATATSEPLRAMTTREAYGLLVPYYGHGAGRSTDQPVGTLTTKDRYALVMRNNTGGAEMTTPVTEPLRTLTTAGHQSLLAGIVDEIPEVDDCYFRMLLVAEIQAAMSFAPDYQLQGQKREKVRMLGNAVTPCAARDLGAALVESLGHVVELAA